jgi:hypothetical protein
MTETTRKGPANGTMAYVRVPLVSCIAISTPLVLLATGSLQSTYWTVCTTLGARTRLTTDAGGGARAGPRAGEDCGGGPLHRPRCQGGTARFSMVPMVSVYVL